MDDVAIIAEGIICKTCVEMGIEIIEIAVNPDQVHIFFRYPPKYSLSYIAKKIKGVSSKDYGKPSRILENGAETECQVVSMEALAMDGRL